VDLIILTSPNPSRGGELCADVDLNTDLKSPFGGDLEGSKRENRKSKYLFIPCLLIKLFEQYNFLPILTSPDPSKGGE
jgi:hypothetical protein